MILAAGLGARLHPITRTVPKPLIEIGGEPIIFRHIRHLAAAGFSSVVINVFHLGQQIKDALGDGGKFNLSIRYSNEDTLLGTAGGIKHALDQQLLTAPFLLINSDVYHDIDFKHLNRPHPDGIDAHLVLIPNPPDHPLGDFSLDQDGHLLPANQHTWTYSGVATLSPSLFTPLPSQTPNPLKPVLLQAIRRRTATATVHNGFWHDIGTPQRLQKARDYANSF